MTKGGARDLGKEAVWRRRLSRHAASGQSVRAWCCKHGVTEAAFYWWRRELVRRDRDAEPPNAAKLDQNRRPDSSSHNRQTNPLNPDRQTASFIPVQVIDAPGPGSDSPIEIVLADGRCVRVTGPVDRQTLTDVLDVLERRAC